MKSLFCVGLLVTATALSATAGTRENSTHTMATGSFGVALIGPKGEILRNLRRQDS